MAPSWNVIQTTTLSNHYDNNYCDVSCNNVARECNVDCGPESEHYTILSGTLYVALAMTAIQFDKAMRKHFERYLTFILRTDFKTCRNADSSLITTSILLK